MRKFIDCNVLEVLEDIMIHNTESYQSDFKFDVERITNAAYSTYDSDKSLIWLSRRNGTHCYSEADAYVTGTSAHNTSVFYSKETGDSLACYSIDLKGFRGGHIIGDLYEFSPRERFRNLKDIALPAYQVVLIYKDMVSTLPYTSDWGSRIYNDGLQKAIILPADLKQWDEVVKQAQKQRRQSTYYSDWNIDMLKNSFTKPRLNEMDFVSSGDMYGIYQLKNEECYASQRFISYKSLLNKGYGADYSHYDFIYADHLKNQSLDDLYEKFNVDHPKDFKGHSLSMSDIIVLKKEGEITAYYVDRAGFKEVPEFLDGLCENLTPAPDMEQKRDKSEMEM